MEFTEDRDLQGSGVQEQLGLHNKTLLQINKTTAVTNSTAMS